MAVMSKHFSNVFTGIQSPFSRKSDASKKNVMKTFKILKEVLLNCTLCKLVPLHAMQALRGRGDIAPTHS
jgi:hypothetical protein